MKKSWVMDDSDFAVMAIAITVVLALIAWIVKASTLRGSVYREWSTRVDKSIAGLDEFAYKTLHDIFSVIRPWLDTNRHFWPEGPLPDPFSLSDLISKYARALRFRERLEKDIERLMRVGPFAVLALVLGIVSVVLFALRGVGILDSHSVIVTGYAVSAAAGSGLLAALGSYVILHHRLTSVELLAAEGVPRA